MKRTLWFTMMACLPLAAAHAGDDFVPDDQIISDTQSDLPAPEFDQVSGRMLWQDRFNELWIADIDPVTGDITPMNGRGQMIDVGLAPVAEVGNTPRYAYGEPEPILVYTRKEGSTLHLAAAPETSPGVWLPELLMSGEDRFRANGSPDGTSGPPRIVYNRDTPEGDTVVSWRDWNDPSTEGTANVVAQGGRFLGTERSLLVLNDVDGVTQVIEIDLDTGDGTQITFGGQNKLNPFIWYAPEYRDFAFVVMLSFTQLGIYRRIDDVWTRVNTFVLPSDKPLLSSPEGFALNGRSYISVVAADELGTGQFPGQPVGPSEIWLTGIDPDEPFFRRLDDPNTTAQRSEPEPYILDTGPVIYYTQLVEQTGSRLLRRAATGLGPELGYDAPEYGGSWSSQHRDNRNSGSTPFAIADTFASAYSVVVPNVQFLRPAMGPEGNLYFSINVPAEEGDEKYLVAVDTNTGSELFRIDEKVASSRLSATNVLVDAAGDIYVPANEALSKFDATGARLWRIPIAGLARSMQFAPDGNLIFFTWNGIAYVVSPDDGTVLLERNMLPWRTFPDDPSCLSGGVLSDCAYLSAPAVDPVENVIYNAMIRGDGDTVIQALRYDEATYGMTSVWRRRSPVVEGLTSSPVLSADYSRLYIQDGVGNLIAVDTASGELLWTFPLGFVSEQPPVVTANGFIMPGGTQDQAAGYDFIGVIEDLGTSAQWTLQDTNFVPASSAAAGPDDRFVVTGRFGVGGPLQLLVVEPNGVFSASPWGAAEQPDTLKGLTVREDGWIFVQAWGQVGVRAFQPLP